MKTVRTRVKSAFNKRSSTSKPFADFSIPQDLEPSSTTSGQSMLLPSSEQELTQEPLTVPSLVQHLEDNHIFPEFHLHSDPFADLSPPPPNLNSDPNPNSNKNTSRRNTVTNTRDRGTSQHQNIAFLPEIPAEESANHYQQQQQHQEEENYMLDSTAQAITITDDSRRSTPKKKKKSVPRASSTSVLPSTSITSRILTVIPHAPETTTMANQQSESKMEFSPVKIDLNYFANEPERETSLLKQPQPTESSFHEITPPQGSQPIPLLHDILTEKFQRQRRTETPIQSDHLAPFNPNEESKPLLDPSLLTSEIGHVLESSTVWPLPPQTFPTLGWTEHVLPSSAYYYSHAATRTVTDLDLRDNKKLDALMHYIDAKRSPKSAPTDIVGDKSGTSAGGIGTSGHDTNTIRTLRTEPEFLAEEGIDIWIRDANANNVNTADWVFMPLTNWVMHATRAVSYDAPSDKDPAPEDLSDAERLSLEYKYWQYMCTHPAHVSIPQSAYDEALEVLTWCYTDSVLRAGSNHASQPSFVSGPYPPPFSFKECTALLELTRNVSSSASSSASQTIRTRLIAQILLRYTEWRQKYITRSLPTTYNNTMTGRSAPPAVEVEHALPFKKTFEGFVKSVICLGIPYLFERDSNGNESGSNISYRSSNEEEQGERLGNGKTSNVNVSVDASQPIMAALLLSASATMLTFPSLNQATRVSAMISALFAVTSMASYGVTLYSRSQQHRDSNPIQSSSQYHEHEHEDVPPNNSIILSFPLVLLTYSLCAFVAGVLAYALQGPEGSANGRVPLTGWVILAVWIALVGILAAFAACLRR